MKTFTEMNKITPLNLFKLDKVDLDVPPEEMFERLFGYSGDQRFVSFFLLHDDLMFDDGCIAGTGRFYLWSTWRNHEAVRDHLAKYDFSASDRLQMPRLLLDRVHRKLYAGHDHLVSQVVIRQQSQPIENPEEITPELWQQYIEKLMAAPSPLRTVEEAMQALDKEQEELKKLRGWLSSKTEMKNESAVSIDKRQIIPFGILRLNQMKVTPPPPQLFEDLMGVRTESRFVAFWYENDQLHWGDGHHRKAGNTSPWKLWRWSMTADILGKYCFGYEDNPADHYLVLDRQSRKLYAVPALQAESLLQQQFPFKPAGGKKGVKQNANFDFFDESTHADEMSSGLESLKRWLHRQATGSSSSGAAVSASLLSRPSSRGQN